MEQVLEGGKVVKITFSASDVALLDEVAHGIGCSRSAVASYLIDSSLESIAAVSKKKRRSVFVECRRLFGMAERVHAVDAVGKNINSVSAAEASKVLRARGASMAYISVAINSLLSLDEARHGSRF